MTVLKKDPNAPELHLPPSQQSMQGPVPKPGEPVSPKPKAAAPVAGVVRAPAPVLPKVVSKKED